MNGVLTCLPTAAAVQDLQRLFYEILNCGLSHENEPPSIPLFNLVAPHMCCCNVTIELRAAACPRHAQMEAARQRESLSEKVEAR